MGEIWTNPWNPCEVRRRYSNHLQEQEKCKACTKLTAVYHGEAGFKVTSSKTKIICMWDGKEGFDFLGMHHGRMTTETRKGLMYVSMIFQAVFIGYSVGTAPVIGYHYGAGAHKELQGLRKKSFVLIGIFAVIMFIAAVVLAKLLSVIFVGYDRKLLDLTVHAFSIFSVSFLFSGFAIFGSSFFTALNDGLISAAISFLRTLVFQIAAVMLLPLVWKVDGIWLSIVAAEVMAVIVTVFFLKKKQGKYHY